MTVSVQTSRTSAVGSGAAGQVVPFGFPAADSSELLVMTRVTATGAEATLVETTNYTVSLTGDTGGAVTTVTAVEATKTIHVIRRTPMTQTMDLTSGGTFEPESIEDAADKAVKLAIERSDVTDRCLRLPSTDSATAELPAASTRANKYLAFDAGGAPTVATETTAGTLTVSSFIETVLDDTTAAAARATLGVVSQATYTVYKSGSTYYAKASGESGLADLSNANYVDLIDAVMVQLKSDVAGGTSYVQGNSVAHARGLYTLTKPLVIPPTQDFKWDSTMAQFDGGGTIAGTGHMIEVNSCMNCIFNFGLLNVTVVTTGAALCIKPTLPGPDNLATCTDNEFFIQSAGSGTASTALRLEASVGDIYENTFRINELAGCDYAMRIPQTASNKTVIGNLFLISAIHNVKYGIVIDGDSYPANIRNNVFTGVIEGRSGEGLIGLDIDAQANTFVVNAFTWNGSGGKSVIFRANSERNLVIGYIENGYTDEASGKNLAIITDTTDGQMQILGKVRHVGGSLGMDDGYGIFADLGGAGACGFNFDSANNCVRVYTANTERGRLTGTGPMFESYNIQTYNGEVQTYDGEVQTYGKL